MKLTTTLLPLATLIGASLARDCKYDTMYCGGTLARIGKISSSFSETQYDGIDKLQATTNPPWSESVSRSGRLATVPRWTAFCGSALRFLVTFV